MKRYLITTLALFCGGLFSQAYAQNQPITTAAPNNFETKIVSPSSPNKPVVAQNGYTADEINNLNLLLQKQNYIAFYDLFEKLNVGSDAQIKYLNEKRLDGHVPLYWLMADYYAKKNEGPETHKWLYVATIMTQQDAELCTDNSAKNASIVLLRSFPAIADLQRKTPQYTEDAMRDVIFFIQNLRTRSNPVWACNFGSKTISATDNILIRPDLWEATRKKVFDRFTENYRK